MVLRMPHARVGDARMGSWREKGCWALVLGMVTADSTGQN